MSDYPKELLANIAKEFHQIIDKYLSIENDVNYYMQVVTTFHMTSLARIMEITKNNMNIKAAKKLRESICLQLHAYPLDEDKTND